MGYTRDAFGMTRLVKRVDGVKPGFSPHVNHGGLLVMEKPSLRTAFPNVVTSGQECCFLRVPESRPY